MTRRGLLVEERGWLARVRGGGPQGEICGAGFVIDERHVVTCAHVAVAAGAAGPGDAVFVDFPLSSVGCGAEVLTRVGLSRGDGHHRGYGAFSRDPDGNKAEACCHQHE